MTYQEFQDEVVTLLSKRLPSNVSIETNTITKNNSTQLRAIIIRDPKLNIAPNIYLEYYYEKYKQDKSLIMDNIIDLLVDAYRNYMPEENFDYESILDFNNVKDKISYRLINYEKNMNSLAETPHIKYLDLAIIFYCLIDYNQETSSSIVIRDNLSQTWGVSSQELYDIAMENAPRLLEPDLTSIQDVMLNMFKDQGLGQEDIPSEEAAPMYVLTNANKTYGASSMLYQGILENFANKCNSDLVIIPSSIHEVLLVPSYSIDSAATLTELITYVNSTSLDSQDILSDHAYYYSRQDSCVSCLQESHL